MVWMNPSTSRYDVVTTITGEVGSQSPHPQKDADRISTVVEMYPSNDGHVTVFDFLLLMVLAFCEASLTSRYHYTV